MMNSPDVHTQAVKFGERLRRESGGDIAQAIRLGYLTAISRPPTAREFDFASSYIGGDPKRLEGFAWMLINLDEFIYVP